jgi:ABC-type uncharacterized transport system permease subunit
VTATAPPRPSLGAVEIREATLGWPRWFRWLVIGILVVLLLSTVQTVADPSTNDLTSGGTWSTTLRFAVPIMLAGLGGIFAERAGIINIGLEGMMILGTWFGAYGALEFGPWWGVAFGIGGGAAGGLLHAIATVTFGVDHIISGVAINIVAPGITRFLSEEVFEARGGGATQSPPVAGVGRFSVPFLSGGEIGGWQTPDLFGRIEGWHDWWFVDDLAGILNGLTSNVSWLTLIAFLLVPLSVFVLWGTRFGLRLRSAGEHPVAADSLGVPVYAMKYWAVIISGALAGLGGVFLAIEQASIYRQGQTQGRGFIGLATVIFGNWRPVGAALGSLLFGFADALQLRDANAIHALLLLGAVALAVAGIRAGLMRRVQSAGLFLLGAAALAVWYWMSDTVPQELPPVAPHIITLFVLVFATTRLRPPAADGMRYRRGQQV